MERYLDAVGQLGLDPSRYVVYLERLFEGVPLEGRSLLDVGGGTGLISFYAALHGARVTCLDPIAEGGHEGMHSAFELLNDAVGEVAPVRLDRRPFQELDPGENTHDVLLLHNSVNHLDEDACMALPEPAAERTYLDLFRTLHGLAAPGAHLVVADAARLNLFGMAHLPNPFVPEITWKLHQQPRVWATLLERTGFTAPEVRWNAMTRAGRPGQLLLSNWLGSFLTQSHFTLVMRRI